MNTTVWCIIVVCYLLLYVLQFLFVFFSELRRPVQMRMWLLVSICPLPLVGMVLYWLLGRETKRMGLQSGEKGNALPHIAQSISEVCVQTDQMHNLAWHDQQRLLELLCSCAPYPITGRNSTQVLTNGQATFDAILQAMRQAKHWIHLDYYIIRADSIGRQFLAVLVSRARAGVAVRLLYDGLGSIGLDRSYITALESVGVETGCFQPLSKWWRSESRLNNRNHRKIVVVDGQIGFMGGINIGDEYITGKKGLGMWRDTHLQLQGDSVYYLQELFLDDWEYVTGTKLDRSAFLPVHNVDRQERVMIVPGKPGTRGRVLQEVLFSAIGAARKNIFIAMPYFIPDEALTSALRSAALGGIDVRLIIPGPADSKPVLLATMSCMGELLEAGVRVYRFQPGFLHCKILIVDDLLGSLGTANFDLRSLYSNYEMNALLFEPATIDRLKQDFYEDLSQSTELTIADYEGRSRLERWKQGLMHLFSPLL